MVGKLFPCAINPLVGIFISERCHFEQKNQWIMKNETTTKRLQSTKNQESKLYHSFQP